MTEPHPPTAAPMQRVYRVQVIDRIFEILDLLAKSKAELGSTDLAQKLGLHKSTVHRLLAVMERHRFVEKNHETAKYNLGWRLFELGTAAASRMGLYGLARPYLAALARKTCETAHLGIINHGEVMSIVSVEADRSLRLPATVGRRSPLYCTSQGKAMLAFSDPAQAEEIIGSLNMKALTRNTITKAARLHDELARIRKAGYAIDNEELEEGLRCIGAPVFDHAGQPIAAVSIAGPAYRVGGGHLPRLTEAVIQTSRQLSSALGFQRAPDAAPSRRRQSGLGA